MLEKGCLTPQSREGCKGRGSKKLEEIVRRLGINGEGLVLRERREKGGLAWTAARKQGVALESRHLDLMCDMSRSKVGFNFQTGRGADASGGAGLQKQNRIR